MYITHSRNRTGIPAESSIPQPSHASRRGSAATPGKGQPLQRVKTCSGSDCACPTLTQACLDLAQRRSPARFGAARGPRRDWPRLKGAASEPRQDQIMEPRRVRLDLAQASVVFWPKKKQAKRSRRANLALATQGRKPEAPARWKRPHSKAHCDSSMLRCGSLRRQPWASYGDLCTLHRQHLGCRRPPRRRDLRGDAHHERDGYALSGLGRFTMIRLKLVSAAEASYWPSRRRRLRAG